MPHIPYDVTGQKANPTSPTAFTPVPATPTSWLDRRHPDYQAMAHQWSLAHLTYTGEFLTPTLLPHFLIQRAQGESPDAFAERQRLADYTSHFGTVVDALAGLLFSNEDDITRVLRTDDNAGIGDLSVTDDPLTKFWTDVDGQGTSWTSAHKRLAVDAIVFQRMWGLVSAENGTPRLHHLPPLEVLDWVEPSPGYLTEALVLTTASTTPSLQTFDPTTSNTVEYHYIHYTTKGWTAYRKNADGNPEPVPGETGTYALKDRWGRATIPLFRTTIPLRRYVGWLLATKAMSIFNLENARDYVQWIGSFSKLNLVATDAAFDRLTDSLRAGNNVLQDDPSITKSHHYINPPTENARNLTDSLKRKVEEFYITAFREYSDSAIERTATEIRQETAQGIGAFLQLLKAALDDAETQALGRVAQVLYPNEPDRWWIARVERSNEIIPPDPQVLIERLITRTYGQAQAVPWGTTGQVDAALEIARYDGRVVDRDEVTRTVTLRNLQTHADLLRDVMSTFPPDTKAALGFQVAQALGLPGSEAAFKEQVEANALSFANETRALNDLRNAMPPEGAGDEE